MDSFYENKLFSNMILLKKEIVRTIMSKIIIIGCPGSGKSTFARKLRDITGITLYYLDMIWHKSDKSNVSREEFNARLNEILKSDSWIIDGNYIRTLEIRLRECDCVFLMDFPIEICLSGAEERIGKKREDMPWLESEFDSEFKSWIENFPNEQLPRIYELLNKYKNDKKVIIFKSREEADKYLASLSN